jgi:hypothetical protein
MVNNQKTFLMIGDMSMGRESRMLFDDLILRKETQ